MVFIVSPKRYLGDRATIVALDEQGQEIPVLHIMDGDFDFPGSVEELAANIVSLLNGNEPMHSIDLGPHDIFWKRDANGVELRLNDGGRA